MVPIVMEDPSPSGLFPCFAIGWGVDCGQCLMRRCSIHLHFQNGRRYSRQRQWSNGDLEHAPSQYREVLRVENPSSLLVTELCMISHIICKCGDTRRQTELSSVIESKYYITIVISIQTVAVTYYVSSPPLHICLAVWCCIVFPFKKSY